MWCCPAQCRAVEVGLAPSDHIQEGDHDDHVVQDQGDNDDANQVTRKLKPYQ